MTISSTARQPKGVPVGGQFAATAHAEPALTLTPATGTSTSSRGRTTTVTLPNGVVATRTSKTKTYSHAVVLSEEVPELVVASRESSIRASRTRIKDLTEALENPKFAKRQRFPGDKDPDVGYQGKPIYHGFEYFLMSPDGKTRLGDTRGNSTGDTQGMYDVETGDYDVHKVGRAIQFLKDQAVLDIKNNEQRITDAEIDISAVQSGTYDLGSPGVASWSSRADLAAKAAAQWASTTRRTMVVPVDE
ncbi:hypothetical protein ACQCSX_22075 (plasmid) [Pseudarthrobacter sp. P1]|uniref:hypothetical protein n=1 Tax=Pseudarthrobacter sp. P1 TaxID=3418418 RepID=UPI003CF19447